MEAPGPLINGERFNHTKVVIWEGSQHSDITDGLISLDYTDEFIFVRDMPWPLAGHQESMTISKEA